MAVWSFRIPLNVLLLRLPLYRFFLLRLPLLVGSALLRSNCKISTIKNVVIAIVF